MKNKNINYLDMQLHKENDVYYLEKLNGIMQNNNSIILKTKDVNFVDSGNKQKGCKEWICRLFSSCLKKEEGGNDPKFVGLINIGNNCYLNAGLQILSRCYPLMNELLKSNYERDELINLFVEAMKTLLFKKEDYYNPTKFVNCFCERNREFVVGQQNCSQDFIRTMLRNINEIFEKKINHKLYNPKDEEEINAYSKYLSENNIFPESKPFSIFSGLLKIHINGVCTNCKKEINNYSFSSFIDQVLYLNSFNERCKFSEVLEKNIGKKNNAIMNCPKCKEKIKCKSISKFVKIPEIFIFTLERFLVRNKVPIEPDEFINIYDLIDESLKLNKNNCKYELFAVNIRLGDNLSFGHEICHIKDENQWYTINDKNYHIKNEEYLENSYGLFYRRINNS